MKNQKGFSFLELSIAMIIVGMLFTVVLGGKRFMDYARHTKAMDATLNSPLSYIDDLALWLESSSDSNFEMDSNRQVSVWYDKSGRGNDVSQSTSDYQPIFVRDALGGRSAVLFDSTDDYLELVINEYLSASTIFVVYQKVNEQDNFSSLFASHNNSIIADSYQIDYSGDLLRIHSKDSDAGTISPQFFETEVNDNLNIASLVMDENDNMKGYFNGSLSFDTDVAAGFLPRYNRYRVGMNRSEGSNFGGYIAEVILFNKTLYTTEREAVESYLAKKYDINLQ